MRQYFKTITLTSLLLFVSSFLFIACEYKDLCYQHPHTVNVRVQFDWAKAPYANPEGMAVLFYDLNNPSAAPQRFDLPGRDGGIVKLETGTYRALAYNYDASGVIIRGTESISTVEAYTRPSSIEEGTGLSGEGMPRANGTESQNVILEPDSVWAATYYKLTIDMVEPVTYDNVKEGHNEETKTDYTIVMQPERRIRQITVTIRNVPNLQYTSNFAGAISTLAPSVFLETGNLGKEDVTQAFTLSNVADSTLQADILFFGHCPNAADGTTNSHILTVYAILADGSKWYYTIDVTDQMHDATKNPDPYHIYIDVDNLPAPKPIVNGGGLHPTIDTWQGVEIPVTME
jgi:hypothetical protein